MGLQDQISEVVENNFKKVRMVIFGQNNERIDFLMDSFYKLTPQQRTGVLAGGVGLVILFITGAVGFYFSQARALESELGSGIAALQELKHFKNLDLDQDRRFTELTGIIRRKSNVNFKPFFEKIAQSKNVVIRDINEKVVDLPSDDPLSESFNRVNIEINVQKISIPRLLGFITEVEKSGNYVRLQDLKVMGQYGTKLYFTADLVFGGYQAKR